MKKLIALVLIVATITGMPIRALADCDFSKDIQNLPDGRYSYSPDCHRRVGKMVQDLKDREDQVSNLNKAIELKDLTIQMDEKRADLWMNTATKLEDRVTTMDSIEKKNTWLYFGLGVVFTGLAVWGAGQLRK